MSIGRCVTETIYNTGEYLEKNPGWHAEDSAWKAGQIIRMLERHDLHPKTVCEVGCGAGEILKRLHDQLPDDVCFVGYEVSPQAYEIAQTRAGDRLVYRLADVSQESQRFDLMLVMDVIEHVEDYFSFLRGVRNKGGRMIAHIPLDMCVNHLLRQKPLSDLREVVGHIHSFTRESALSSLRECGFRVVDHFYTTWAMDFPPRTWRRRAARWPRRIAYSLSPDLAARVLGGFSLLVLAEPAEPARTP